MIITYHYTYHYIIIIECYYLKKWTHWHYYTIDIRSIIGHNGPIITNY